MSLLRRHLARHLRKRRRASLTGASSFSRRLITRRSAATSRRASSGSSQSPLTSHESRTAPAGHCPAQTHQNLSDPVTICQYTGLLRLLDASGLGVAVKHQRETYRRLGVRLTESPLRCDAVHLNSVFPDSVLVGWLARRLGRPVVVHAHSTEEDFRGSFRGSDLLAPLFRHWIRFVYSQADLLLTPTEYSKRLVTAYGVRRPVAAISNGIDTDTFAPDPAAGQRFRERYGLRGDDRVVVSVGHYFARKGIIEFVEVARQLPDVHFVWFGSTPRSVLTPDVAHAIDTAPTNVLFPGFVPADQIRDAFCGADAFCFLTREETEGIVVLEALACETPVIVRDIPVYEGWLSPDATDKIDASDYPAIAAQAAQSLRSIFALTPDQRAARVARGRGIAADRSLDAVAQRLASLLESVGVPTLSHIPERAQPPMPTRRSEHTGKTRLSRIKGLHRGPHRGHTAGDKKRGPLSHVMRTPQGDSDNTGGSDRDNEW
ncbi:glycosyltransferase family 4 protein [Devriesea agamarum]|uniref:glycosyltransferase family 4 protein n=1 Tax=Devriesea agamarum TaxID=472569 RepID=UPI000A0545DD|nr:glycosyltransferase family 4 protein [Devriesea agamarum]